MTEVIRISDSNFLVKEVVDDFNTENSIVYISYNMENSTRSFSLTQKEWQEASKKYPIENLELTIELLNARGHIDNEESEKEQEMTNWDVNNFHIFFKK